MKKSLLIQAIPYDGESAASFLLRTAQLNGHSSVYQLFGKERFNYLAKNAPNCDLTDFPRFKFALQILNINTDYQKLAFRRCGPTSRSPKKWGELEISEKLLEVHKLSYCPICLAEEPFFRKIWLFTPLYACPRHAVTLLNCCHECGKEIKLTSGVKHCGSCGFKLENSPTTKCKSLKEIKWFLEILNHNSNDFFQYFSSYWLALKNFAEVNSPMTNESLLSMAYEYFHKPHEASEKLSSLINDRIKLSHPRVQLLPFLKHGKLFREYVNLVESKCHPYVINPNSYPIQLSLHEIRLVLGLSRETMKIWINQNYLNFEDKNHYFGDISSRFIEKFLTDISLKTKHPIKPIFNHPPYPETLCLKGIAEALEINYETARKLAKMNWFDNEIICSEGKRINGYSLTKLAEFKNRYMVVSQIAKRAEMNPTNLVEKIGTLGILPIHGPHIDSTPINIFLKNSVYYLRASDFDHVNKYRTRTGRPLNDYKPLETYQSYYSLSEAGNLLGIGSSKVANLVRKDILKQKLNNPFDIKIPKQILFNLKEKLDSNNYISYKEAAEKLNCPLNWMNKYWCLTGYLEVEDLIYWKLVKQNELKEVLKLKEEYVTGAEASEILGMNHNHITNLQSQGLITSYWLGKTDTKIRLFKRSDVIKLKI